MNGPLNSSVEIGVRVLVLLAAAFPRPYDLDALIMLDHGLLHSADLGGPPSLHPNLPMRIGEIGAKRALMEDGLRMMMRAGLVEVRLDESGVKYKASENAEAFVDLLETEYASELRARADWVIEELAIGGLHDVRTQLRAALSGGLKHLEAGPAPLAEEVISLEQTHAEAPDVRWGA